MMAALLYLRPAKPGTPEYRAVAYFTRLHVARRLAGLKDARGNAR
jgi:hypothetical protein